MLTGTHAVFQPADRAALQTAVGTCTKNYNFQVKGFVYTCTGGCLGENSTGYCPDLAARDATHGNPYGAISGWDTSLVTDMTQSKL